MFHPYEVLDSGEQVRRTDLPSFKEAGQVREYLIKEQTGNQRCGTFTKLNWIECSNPVCAECNLPN